MLFSLVGALLVLNLFFVAVPKIVVPLATRGYDGADPFYQSRFERYLWRYSSALPLGILYFGLALALLVVSVVCSVKGDKWARLGYFCIFLMLVLWVVVMPAFSRAREKPVIYLYPETRREVNVRLLYDGTLLHTYPLYSQEGWDVMAEPSGKLVDLRTGRTHYCLFWEGEDRHRWALDEGFVVEGKNAAAFLESALSELGLSEREANEFIIYWLPRMEKNRYNVVHFASDEYKRRVPIQITPKPDTSIRVFMVFKPVDRPVDIPPQKLKRVERRGFTVVEWGGTELH